MIEINGQKLRVDGKLVRIARLDGENYLFAEYPEAIVEDLKAIRNRIDIFTFIQKPSDPLPKYKYPMEQYNLAVLSITSFDDWWNKQIGFKARNKAKQAEKRGVVLREVPFSDSLVRGIWEIYNECPVRQGKRFPHFGKDIATVHREEATYLDCSAFIGAFQGDRLIGFVKLLIAPDGSQAGLLNIVSMIEHRDKAPTNALIAHSVRFCAERGIPYLVYSNFAYGKRSRDSLSDFKERNAFERVDLPRYYIPLTPLGWTAIRLGMHKKLLDRIPEPVIVKFRELRGAWYGRKAGVTGQRGGETGA